MKNLMKDGPAKSKSPRKDEKDSEEEILELRSEASKKTVS